jgi:hypothetical protein
MLDMQNGLDPLLDLYHARLSHFSPVHAGMRAIEQIYNGDFTVTIADLEKNEKAAVPNLLRQGVDQMAGRVASVVPQVFFASENPGARNADRKATQAARVIGGWWQLDRLPIKTRTRARHLIAYGMAPTVVTYDPKTNRPCWNVRNPMECFPSMEMVPGTFTPTDVIFAYRRPASWLRAKGYGTQLQQVTARRLVDIPKDQQFILLEYVDPDIHLLAITGTTQPNSAWSVPAGAMRIVPLEIAQNPTGVMNATVPTRLTLGRASGQFDSMIAMYYMQSRLMALEIAAIEKGVFPDTYLVSRPGEQARFIDGPHDGRTGRVNILSGGDIKEMDTSPGYKTDGMIDRMERSQRLTAGIPAEFGGESATNIRTGRRGDQVLSGVIDFPVGEAQEVLAFALQEEDRAAIALAKHYDGSAPRTIYVGTGNQVQKVTYVSSQVFTHDEHRVSYPVSGADVNSLIMGIGQRVGMGLMSKETGAEMDPWIDNAETEHDRIIAEGLEQALVGGLQQQAAAGAIPPLVLGKIMSLVRNDKMELAEAMVKVTEDAAREQQEAEAAAGPPTAEQQMAPAAQQAMAGQIPGASPDQQSLSGLLTALRKPAMAVADRTGLTDQNTGRQLV